MAAIFYSCLFISNFILPICDYLEMPMVWFYSAPPIKLSYRRFGEVANVINGFIMPATGYFVMMGTIDLPFLIFSIPFVFLQLVFTVGVEIPNLEGDKMGGKITWTVSKVVNSVLNCLE